MSYTYKVKNEILHRCDLNEDEKYAEIRAILLLKHAINQNSIELKLENKEIAERIYFMLKELTNLQIFIKFSKREAVILYESNKFILAS